MIFPQSFFLDTASESADNKHDLRGVHLPPKDKRAEGK